MLIAHYREAARQIISAKAVTLTVQGRNNEAIEHFRILLPYEPAFWPAHYLLGVEFSAQGKLAEAQTQFSEVLRYRPDFVPAPLDLGGRSREAGQAGRGAQGVS